jgi:pimeloyl-ACP methyl ester carboxylesterase
MRLTSSDCPPIGYRIKVGGRYVWMYRSGQGVPAAVFVTGAGAIGLDYLMSHERVAKLTTSVLYDRAGTGWSDDVELPRGLDDVADELRELLDLIGEPPPYILIGHSLGGAYAHRYAQRFPADLAALLLIEPAHPEWDSFMPEHLKLAANQTASLAVPEFSEELRTFARAQLDSGIFDAFPPELREMLIDKHTSPDRLLVGMQEGLNVLAIMEELRAGGPLPDVPLIVLSGTAIGPEQTAFQTEDNLREQIAGSQRLFDAIAATARYGEHRSIPDASHVSLPMTRPDAVAAAVHDLLKQLRQP